LGITVLLAAGQVGFENGQTWLACGVGSDRLLMCCGRLVVVMRRAGFARVEVWPPRLEQRGIA